MRRNKDGAFSLVEVVLAVGIVAGALTVILALLPSLAKETADSDDVRRARQLAAPIRIALEARAQRFGMSSVAASVPTMSAPLTNGFALVGSRDGMSALLEADANKGPDAQYFLVEAWRFAAGPLAFEQGSDVLPLWVRVSWPYRVPGTSALTAPAARSRVEFVVVVKR